MGGRRRFAGDDLARSQRNLQFSFLRAARFYASGRHVGLELLALGKGSSLPIVAGELRARGRRSAGCARPLGGSSLRIGSLERGADGRGVCAGTSLGEALERGGYVQRVRRLSESKSGSPRSVDKGCTNRIG